LPETKKNEINWKKLVGAIILAVLVGLPLLFIFGYEKVDHSYSFSYSIRIDQSGVGNYTMIVPFPAFDRANSHWNGEILEKLRTQPGLELALVETQQGLGLEIRATESCELMVDYNIDVPASFLTLDNYTSEMRRPTYLVFANFFNGTDLELRIFFMNEKIYSWKRAGEIDSWASGGGPRIRVGIEQGDLLLGWNQYIGDNSTLIIN